jgi:TPR repeat protein
VTGWETGGPHPDPPLSHQTWAAVLEQLTPDTAFPVGTAAYDAGIDDIYDTGMNDIAEQAWQYGANYDHADAMYALCLLLSNRINWADAEKWWRRAATDHNHAGAMNNLALLLKTGATSSRPRSGIARPKRGTDGSR